MVRATAHGSTSQLGFAVRASGLGPAAPRPGPSQTVFPGDTQSRSRPADFACERRTPSVRMPTGVASTNEIP